MGDGVSRDMNLAGPLEAMRASLQGIRDDVSRPLEIPVRVVVERTPSVGDGRSSGSDVPGALPPIPGILPSDQDWSLRPSHRRHRGAGAWDGPEDFPDADQDRLSLLGNDAWDKLTSGGAYHTLAGSGGVGRKWGSFLEPGRAMEQREWSDAAASPNGRKYMDSSEEVERIGKRISGLMRDIAQGGAGASKAADELKKAQEALEKVGNAGKEAADSLGGDMGTRLKAELAATQEQAAGGKMQPGAKGANYGAGDILNMVRNPEGAAMHGLVGGAEQLMAMLGPRAAAALGLGGAIIGGVALGAGIVGRQSEKAMADSASMGSDLELSRDMGRTFDFRGAYWNSDRNNAKEGVDSLGARRVLRGMNIGLDNWKPMMAGGRDGEISRMTDEILASSASMGVDSDAVSGFVGRSISTGAASKSEAGVTSILHKMMGYLARSAEQGVTANESLRAVASLNAQQVQTLGKMTEGGSNFNMNLMDALNRTGDPALRGERGAAAVSGGPLQGNQIPMVLGGMVKDKEAWKRLAHTALGDDAERFLSQPEPFQIFEANENSVMRNAAKLSAIDDPRFSGIPTMVKQRMLGFDNISASTFRTLEGSGISDRESILAMGDKVTHGGQYIGQNALAKDRDRFLLANQYKSYSDDNQATGVSAETAAAFKGAVSDFGQFVNRIQRSLDKEQHDMSVFDLNAPNLWYKGFKTIEGARSNDTRR